MKKIKKLSTPRLVSALMALLLFFTAFASFGAVKANATTDQISYNNVYTSDIYYFYDLYPTLNPVDSNAIFPSANLYYDRNHVSAQDFSQMVHYGYFSGFDGGDVVIIDIKTFKPDFSILELLFEPIHDDGAITIFVSTYSQSIFMSGAYPYVDFYFETDLGNLKNFVRNSFLDASDKQICPTSDATILLDNNLINVNEYENASIDELCAVSPYLRFIMKALTVGISVPEDPSSYNGFVTGLTNSNVQLIVYTDTTFVNILTWETVDSPLLCLNNGFAIGFWEFEESFYSYLYNLKQQRPNFPIYVFEAELIEYSEDGLPINSASDLEEVYSREITNEYYFLDALIGFLNSLE